MSNQYRRPRGTPKVALNLFVAPDVKDLIDSYASQVNAPIWAIVEAAIRAGKPDATGFPEGWTLPQQQKLNSDAGGEPVRRTA